MLLSSLRRVVQMRAYFTALVIAGTLTMLSSCAKPGYSNLSTIEVAKIENIYVGGITRSRGNTHLDIPNHGYYRKFRQAFITELDARGYTVVDTLSESNYSLLLEKSEADNYPSGVDISGAGYYAHNSIGRAVLIQLQIQMTATLYYPKNIKQQKAIVSTASSNTLLYEPDNAWPDYNTSRHKDLIDAADNAQRFVASKLLDRLNLLARK